MAFDNKHCSLLSGGFLWTLCAGNEKQSFQNKNETKTCAITASQNNYKKVWSPTLLKSRYDDKTVTVRSIRANSCTIRAVTISVARYTDTRKIVQWYCAYTSLTIRATEACPCHAIEIKINWHHILTKKCREWNNNESIMKKHESYQVVKC